MNSLNYTITRADLNCGKYENCTSNVPCTDQDAIAAPNVMLMVIYNVLQKEAVGNDKD